MIKFLCERQFSRIHFWLTNQQARSKMFEILLEVLRHTAVQFSQFANSSSVHLPSSIQLPAPSPPLLLPRSELASQQPKPFALSFWQPSHSPLARQHPPNDLLAQWITFFGPRDIMMVAFFISPLGLLLLIWALATLSLDRRPAMASEFTALTKKQHLESGFTWARVEPT